MAELLADYFEVDGQEIMPLEPCIVMENSCNDSTASGNINSQINIAKDLVDVLKNIAQQNVTNQEIIITNQNLVIENQKMIIVAMKK
jgi:hypothetical protein